MNHNIWAAALVSCLGVAQAHSHEVWIEPERWTVPDSGILKADIKNGENFEGFDLFWKDESSVRAEVWTNNTATRIRGRLGDRPALSAVALGADTLMTLLYQSTHRNITYNKFDKFASFVTEKGYGHVLAEHAERDLPRTPIKEAYARYAKALVASGSGDGSDAPRGLELELVALENPYQRPLPDKMTVQLHFNDAPLVGNQVTVFRRAADDMVDTEVLQSDGQGQVQFALAPGITYLVDAVVIREPSRDLVVSSRGAVWESLWSSLTFQVPADQ